MSPAGRLIHHLPRLTLSFHVEAHRGLFEEVVLSWRRRNLYFFAWVCVREGPCRPPYHRMRPEAVSWRLSQSHNKFNLFVCSTGKPILGKLIEAMSLNPKMTCLLNKFELLLTKGNKDVKIKKGKINSCRLRTPGVRKRQQSLSPPRRSSVWTSGRHSQSSFPPIPSPPWPRIPPLRVFTQACVIMLRFMRHNTNSIQIIQVNLITKKCTALALQCV